MRPFMFVFMFVLSLSGGTVFAQVQADGVGGVCAPMLSTGTSTSATCGGISVPCTLVAAADLAPEAGIESVFHCTNRNYATMTLPPAGTPVVNHLIVADARSRILFDSRHREFGFGVVVVGNFVLVGAPREGVTHWWILGSPARGIPLRIVAEVADDSLRAGYSDLSRWVARTPPDLTTDSAIWQWDAAGSAYRTSARAPSSTTAR